MVSREPVRLASLNVCSGGFAHAQCAVHSKRNVTDRRRPSGDLVATKRRLMSRDRDPTGAGV